MVATGVPARTSPRPQYRAHAWVRPYVGVDPRVYPLGYCIFLFAPACLCHRDLAVGFWFLFIILWVQNLEPIPCNRNLDLVLIHGSDGRPCPYISDAFIMSSRHHHRLCHLDLRERYNQAAIQIHGRLCA